MRASSFLAPLSTFWQTNEMTCTCLHIYKKYGLEFALQCFHDALIYETSPFFVIIPFGIWICIAMFSCALIYETSSFFVNGSDTYLVLKCKYLHLSIYCMHLYTKLAHFLQTAFLGFTPFKRCMHLYAGYTDCSFISACTFMRGYTVQYQKWKRRT